MSKFAILKKFRPGSWTEEGEITVHVDHIAAIEEEPGCGGSCTRLTLTGGREVCVQGDHKFIRRALVRQAKDVGGERSLFEEVFGREAVSAMFGRRRG